MKSSFGGSLRTAAITVPILRGGAISNSEAYAQSLQRDSVGELDLTMMIDAATALAFSMYENKGVYALLLGSGVSRSAAIPTGWEITLDLARRVGRLEGEDEQVDWAKWHQERFGEAPNYGKLLDAVSTTPDERRSILHAYIEPTPEEHAEGLKTPTRAHRAIAKLVRDGIVRVIITTNFDRLLETALRDVGVEPTVIKSDDDLAGAVPLIHSRCFILKVHGDYLDTRLRNTEGELAGYSEVQNRCLDRILDDHGLIVCGWSADWDEALRAAITRAPSRRYPLFWAGRGAPTKMALDLIAQRSGRVVPIAGADEFFEDLQAKVEVQDDLKRPNPESVDLMGAMAKRYLGRPDGHIPLSDLVGAELARLREAFSRPDLAVQGVPLSADAFRRRVALYDAACERIIRLAFLLGQWGDGQDLRLLRDMLEFIRSQRAEAGTTRWLQMQAYPGVLVLFAWGVGAVRAERWAHVRAALRLEFERPYRDSTYEAVELFYLRFEAHDKDLWNQLDGMERHLAPLAGHLFDVFTAQLASLFPSLGDFQLAYETFETLASCTLVELRVNKDSLRTALEAPGGRGYVYVPLGPSGWDENRHATLLRRFKEDGPRNHLLAGGFANGDSDYLVLLTRNLEANMAHWRW